jgi:SAM-dependent methyltransferase
MFLLKIPCYLIAFLITYVGGLFVPRPKEQEMDISSEAERERIFDQGIEYWEMLLGLLGLNIKAIDVLEVGSGNGQWLIAFSHFAKRVCGLEPNEDAREYSAKKIKEFGLEDKIELNGAGAENIPYEDQSFDLLFCAGVFMFTNQKLALKEFNRVLKGNGILLVTVNGLGYFIMYILNGMRYFSINKTYYGLVGLGSTLLKWFTGKQMTTCAVSHTEMKQILEEQGFELKESRIWIDMELYPLEHFGFVTNYAFIAQKKYLE